MERVKAKRRQYPIEPSRLWLESAHNEFKIHEVYKLFSILNRIFWTSWICFDKNCQSQTDCLLKQTCRLCELSYKTCEPAR